MRRRNVAVGLAIVAVVAFLFLFPMVSVGPIIPPPCPLGGCNYPMYGSLTYWAFKVGGVWMGQGYYTMIL